MKLKASKHEKEELGKPEKEVKKKKNPYKQELSEQQKQEIKEAFDLFDTDGSGNID